MIVHVYVLVHVHVYDCTCTSVFLISSDGAVNYDYIVLLFVNCLNSQDVFPMARTLTIVQPIWPVFQNLSKTLMYMYMYLYMCKYMIVYTFIHV